MFDHATSLCKFKICVCPLIDDKKKPISAPEIPLLVLKTDDSSWLSGGHWIRTQIVQAPVVEEVNSAHCRIKTAIQWIERCPFWSHDQGQASSPLCKNLCIPAYHSNPFDRFLFPLFHAWEPVWWRVCWGWSRGCVSWKRSKFLSRESKHFAFIYVHFWD